MNKIGMYVAGDGRVFRTENECFHYEKYDMEVDIETGEPVGSTALMEKNNEFIPTAQR